MKGYEDNSKLFDRVVDPVIYFNRRVDLSGDIGSIMKINTVDLVALNEVTNLVLKRNAVFRGISIIRKTTIQLFPTMTANSSCSTVSFSKSTLTKLSMIARFSVKIFSACSLASSSKRLISASITSAVFSL